MPKHPRDIEAIVDRMEIEALRGEFNDALVMRDYDRFASLFTEDGAWRMPHVNVDFVGREQIRARMEGLHAPWAFIVQTAHPGTIQLEGDTATGRAYVEGLARRHDGSCNHNYSVYHDRYQRTSDGWRFAERRHEIRYLDTTPLAGAPPSHSSSAGGDPA